MDEFLIASATGHGGLLFFDRSPHPPTEPIASYRVRVTDHHLSAEIDVYAGYLMGHPAPFFADLARQWTGWSGELVWQSLEGELTLRCSRDRVGHCFLRVELRPGQMPVDWRVVATILIEAGQLEGIGRRAGLYFGRSA